MSNIPADLKYTARTNGCEGNRRHVTVGITDHAQDALGDLVFVETPEAGRAVKAGEACAVVESVKAASDVYSPIDGEIIEGNEALADAAGAAQQDPYGEGWIMKRPAGAGRNLRRCSTRRPTQPPSRTEPAMPFIPHTEDDIREMLDAIGVAASSAVRRDPAGLKHPTRWPASRRRSARWRSSG
jgi:glycine cleavage system H protein